MSKPTLALVLLLASALPTAAQSVSAEAIAGYAGFVDESFVDHGALGGSARIQLSPRISIGPELIYMRGPGGDRDLFLTGNLTVDLLVPPPDARRGRVSPYVVAGGGLMRHSNRFGQSTFTHSEGAWTGGGGARVWITDRVYALGEVRLGWEPHYRAIGGLGMRWR